ncbi:hypothetical protein [Pelosinus propionicus]|uniref:Uncharacterized protein n=1 Tax=Pelosinus propionicus DSM 13327 TaxID=1123291 RepID=A0A1I4N0L0_9FIRM|nr:hypothetical protein [Pelosinus propionicus]SFM09114.1 hypothetical protein SAMN04490355_104018 [Pelosinus propionicus DSM 13327]
MKRKIPFNLFGEEQELCFTIKKIGELEKVTGKGIQQLIRSEEAGINFCLGALPICLEKKSPDFYVERIEEYLESGGAIDDIATPIAHAILATGIIGKVVSDSVMAIYYPDLYPKVIEDTEQKNE